MRLRKVLLTIAAAGVAVAMALPSHAARFRADFFGEITFADGDITSTDPATNQFGLLAGDTVSGFAIYDTDALQLIGGTAAGTLEFIEVGPGTTFLLELSIGNQTFTQADDDSFGFGFPELYFLDGDMVGFDFQGTNADGFFFTSFPDFSVFDDPGFSGALQFLTGEDPDFFSLIEGDFVFPPGLVNPVDDNNNVIPEPGTMILLGSGLMGLAGYGRKRRKG